MYEPGMLKTSLLMVYYPVQIGIGPWHLVSFREQMTQFVIDKQSICGRLDGSILGESLFDLGTTEYVVLFHICCFWSIIVIYGCHSE